jgi:hypothetical protein
VLCNTTNGSTQVVHFGTVDENPIDAITDDVQRPTSRQSDHRCCRRERLDHRDPEIFLANVDEAGRSRKQRHEFVAFNPLAQLDIWREPASNRRLERPHPYHRQPEREILEGLDDEFWPLVGNEAVDPEKVVRLLLCSR